MNLEVETEAFINEVASRSLLWDKNNEAYRLVSRKAAAWCDIARKFFPNAFDSMSPKDKKEVARKLQNKWRNIRDQWVRNKKKKDHKRADYVYSKHLAFLDGNGTYKQSDDEEWSDEETRPKPQVVKIESDCDSWQDDEYPTNNLKRQKLNEMEVPRLDFMDTALITDSNCNMPSVDEDKSFFDSLLPAVRSFDLDQKLEFRSQVICLIKNIRNGRQTNS